MKMKDLADKGEKELQDLITKTQGDIVAAAIDLRTKQVPNVKREHSLKKQLARALTLQRERQIAAAEAAESQAEAQNG